MRSSNEMRDYNKAFVSTQLEFEARIAHAEARIAHAEVRAADERTARLKAEADSANERVARLKDREEFQQQTEEASKKIQSAHMEAEEANRKAEEANQKAEEANRKALEADRKAEAATHEINKWFNVGFPPMSWYIGPSICSTSSYVAALPLPCDFPIVNRFAQLTRPAKPETWQGKTDISSFAELEAFCLRALSDIIQSMASFDGFSDVQAVANVVPSFTSTKPGIWVLQNGQSGLPFFVVQVKEPDIFDTTPNSQIYGHLYDYLYMLHTDYGIQTPYGMVYTYSEVQVCWLDENCLEQVQERQMKVSRKVFETSQYGYVEAVNAIVSALINVHRSPVRQMRLPYRFFPIFDKHSTETRWASCSPDTRLEMPNGNTNTFFIRQRLGRGADGKAYLVTSDKGCLCVVKFRTQIEVGIDDEKRRLLEQESSFWNSVNQTNARVLTLKDKPALLMPYLEPVNDEERRLFLNRDSMIYHQVSALLSKCVASGFEQIDVSWRHLGWYKYDASLEPKLMMLDFGHMEDINPDESAQILASMLKKLRDDLRYKSNVVQGASS